MRLSLIAMVILLYCNVVYAEVFIWEDKTGVHITENIEKLPIKYQQKYGEFVVKNKSQNKMPVPIVKKTPELALSALKALKKFGARVNTGISYSDYLSVLGETKYEVDAFSESKSANDFPELRSSMELALTNYTYAGTIWKKSRDRQISGFIEITNSFVMSLSKIYPNINKLEKHEIKYSFNGIELDEKWFYNGNDLLSLLWSEADKEIKNIKMLE